VQQRVAAIDRQRRKILNVDISAYVAVVLDVQPCEDDVRSPFGNPLEARPELVAAIAPCGAERYDDERRALGPVRQQFAHLVGGGRQDPHRLELRIEWKQQADVTVTKGSEPTNQKTGEEPAARSSTAVRAITTNLSNATRHATNSPGGLATIAVSFGSTSVSKVPANPL